MPLSAFIRGHHEQIVSEFAVFARTLMPPRPAMTDAELRDHASEILMAVVQDMNVAQTSAEQSLKSQGPGTERTLEASGKLHADDRIQHGFTFRAVLAEFRALRATVLRLYEEAGQSDLTGVRRFNEAIDEAMTESMERFAAQTDMFRDQFIGVLSHDLRTPLGAITAGAALLAAPDDNPDRRARVVTRVMNSTQRMERMIGDLLGLTRTRLGGTLPLKRVPADLQQICEEAMMEIRAGLPDTLLHLQASGDLRGEWDIDRLAQVVSNQDSSWLFHEAADTRQLAGGCLTAAAPDGGRIAICAGRIFSTRPPSGEPQVGRRQTERPRRQFSGWSRTGGCARDCGANCRRGVARSYHSAGPEVARGNETQDRPHRAGTAAGTLAVRERGNRLRTGRSASAG